MTKEVSCALTAAYRIFRAPPVTDGAFVFAQCAARRGPVIIKPVSDVGPERSHFLHGRRLLRFIAQSYLRPHSDRRTPGRRERSGFRLCRGFTRNWEQPCRDDSGWLGIQDSNLQTSFWKMPFEMSSRLRFIPGTFADQRLFAYQLPHVDVHLLLDWGACGLLG